MNRIPFDASQAFYQEINPLLIELRDLCKARGVPILVMVTSRIQETEDAYNFNACFMVEGKVGRMTLLQQAVAMLGELPEDIQGKIVEVIFEA